MKKIHQWVAIMAVMGALAGCARTTAVTQVHSTVYGTHTSQQVHNAILLAGKQRQWMMTDAGNGVISARINSHGHTAEVRIPYTATSYSIEYVSSTNLKAEDGKIHKTYNRWVNNLDQAIQLNLTAGAGL